MGTENNQKFYNVPFYKFKKMLKYKCKLEGMTLIEQEENYTSQASYNILKKYLTKKGVWNEKIFSDCIEVYSTPLLRNF